MAPHLLPSMRRWVTTNLSMSYLPIAIRISTLSAPIPREWTLLSRSPFLYLMCAEHEFRFINANLLVFLILDNNVALRKQSLISCSVSFRLSKLFHLSPIIKCLGGKLFRRQHKNIQRLSLGGSGFGINVTLDGL